MAFIAGSLHHWDRHRACGNHVANNTAGDHSKESTGKASDFRTTAAVSAHQLIGKLHKKVACAKCGQEVAKHDIQQHKTDCRAKRAAQEAFQTVSISKNTLNAVASVVKNARNILSDIGIDQKCTGDDSQSLSICSVHDD